VAAIVADCGSIKAAPSLFACDFFPPSDEKRACSPEVPFIESL
jgi:hypothetical protein